MKPIPTVRERERVVNSAWSNPIVKTLLITLNQRDAATPARDDSGNVPRTDAKLFENLHPNLICPEKQMNM